MTTATLTPSPLDGIRLKFGGVLRSEWIKLRSLRSTMWCLGLVVLLSIGFGLLLALTVDIPSAGNLPDANQHQLQVQVATLGVNFTQLIVAVLGVLVISGEYGTGMIRSTFVAAPGRLGAFFAKAIVLAVTTFVVGVVSIALSAVVAWPILAGKGVTISPMDSSVLLPLLGGAGYLTLIAVLAFAFGAILRNSAGGIATILGLVLVVPTILEILTRLTKATWISNVSAFLPSSAGGKMFAYVDGSTATQAADQAAKQGLVYLQSWEGLLVLVAWVAAGLIVGAVLTKRRDV
ncbi:ABC transporter permease [Humibacter sp.]|uniref:ABC transporter permease n=1 Tax=Humibacter sp. TaxID=1940291 RepID=UPI002C59205D|nr:ABC transporter permease [Humibacter sp.]HVX08276.1 ABC transporter permease [Humibacter sp.]